MKQFIVICSAIFVLSINVLAQGEIITKEQANDLFGPVLVSVSMDATVLKNLLPQSPEVLMFQIVDNELFILDGKRNVLLPFGGTMNNTEVFTLYSKTVLQELLTLSTLSSVYIERREAVLTITSGLFTLEFGLKCPPYCLD
ncbi:MAG: hypothetical protein IPM56_13625 [Ignavibacteriales bacterium]|nr:MAG: hypothetical protein IPM56_13625 [Ignavibacteriales bacterium]